ncbi:MAG: hypothetical protein ACR2QW_14335 [bacterium]
MLAIMFRLGLGMAHGMAGPGLAPVTDTGSVHSGGVYCGPAGEQNKVRLIETLCPVCHALSSVDDLDTGICGGCDAQTPVCLTVAPCALSFSPHLTLVTLPYLQARAPPPDIGDQW